MKVTQFDDMLRAAYEKNGNSFSKLPALSYKEREALRKKNSRQRWASTAKKQNGGYDRTEWDDAYNSKRRNVVNSLTQFIAIDGEGINSCGHEEGCGEEFTVAGITMRNHVHGCQKYALLMASTGERIQNLNGLSTRDCLMFLIRLKEKYPRAIFVIYGGSYDVNKMLKDMPFRQVHLLQKNKKVYHSRYRLEYIPRKYFRISLRDIARKKVIRSLTLWDVIGFYQGAFVGALETYFTNETERLTLQIDKIKEGKAHRSQFSKEDLENFIIPYTTKEVKALVALMNRLRENILAAGLRVNRWDGAGAIAASIFKKYDVKRWYAEIPGEVEPMAQRAYGGGRIEAFMYGHYKGIVYHKDLIGAYPSAMLDLPALVGGVWVHHDAKSLNMLRNEEDVLPWTMYKIYWDYKYRYREDGTRIGLDHDNVLYPFFYRQPWGEPSVFYPKRGYSWVWGYELATALKYQNKLRGRIIVYEAWQFIPATDDKPFAFISDLYQKRLEYKAAGNGAQLALKLGINSLYGKTAQTVGYNREEGRRPPFYSLIYAGLITSKVRSLMFDAAMQKPDKVIAIATDGIWLTEDIDVDEGKGLGQWESEELIEMTSIQAGVYFATKSDGTEIEHYRGFNSNSISKQDILDAWRSNIFWMAIPTQRFSTMGTSIASKERWESIWGDWDFSPRVLRIVPGGRQKREATHEMSETYKACDGLIPLAAAYPHKFEAQVHNPKQLTDYWLSSKHPLPWDAEAGADYKSDEMREMDMEIAEGDM